jgi:BioD-like phosphotransacetylase family protein
MATSIYVTSTQNFSGKSALCAGLIAKFQSDSFAIGYMKPVSTTPRVMANQEGDEDVQFMRSTFGLSDPVATMAPVVLTDQRVSGVLVGEDPQDYVKRVRVAFDDIAEKKNVVVLEGGGSLREGWLVYLAPPHVSKLLNASALVVVPYENDLQVVDDLITALERFGGSFLGAVINSVPKHRSDFIHNEVKPFVEHQGIPVFAILPKKSVLLAASVGELSEGLKGEVLCAHENTSLLVEHLMVGAMAVETALTYFRRKPNKAVITGGDRPDIQLAALETATQCLILTGNIRPGPQIMGRAEELGVPIILTAHDTMTVIQCIESFFGKTRFYQEEKVRLFQNLLDRYFDYKRLYTTLGLVVEK